MKSLSFALTGGLALALVAVSVGAAPGAERQARQAPDARAQSGAAAVADARGYTAQLRHCESLPAAQRPACVAAAKR